MHEDNGAMQTTFALSHLRYGRGVTHAHNLFIDRNTGSRSFYVHHPAAVPLVVALAFGVTGRESAAVARLTMIAFSLGSLAVVLWILRSLFDDERVVLISGFIMATLPMQAFFGRMVNYEAPTLFFVCVQLAAYVSRRHRLLLVAIILGGLFDWPVFFFSIAIAMAAMVERDRPLFVTALAATVCGVAIDLGHIILATGSTRQLIDILLANTGEGHPPVTIWLFLWRNLENFRGYFTHSGLVVSLFGVLLLGTGRLKPAATRFLAISGGAAAAYVVSSPVRAIIHHYWEFYFIPFVVVCFALAIAWLLEKRATMVVALMLVEVAISSGYKLYRRHTRPDAWAVRATAELEANYLIPATSPE